MVDFDRSEWVTIEIECRLCHKKIGIQVKRQDWESYKRRESHVQDLFPYLTGPQRELFISRTCEECWKKIFSK